MAISGLQGASNWTNVFWFDLGTSTPTHADLTALLDAVTTQYQTKLMVTAPTFFHLNEARVAWWGASAQREESKSYNIAGASSGAVSIPSNAAMVASWHIDRIYRGGKPRTYFAGLKQADTADTRTFTSVAVAAYQTNFAGFLSGCNALTPGSISSVTLGTVSFFVNGGSTTIPPTYRTPPVFEPYVGVSIQTRVCSQRRRLGKEIL